jgi:hypothetical protein
MPTLHTLRLPGRPRTGWLLALLGLTAGALAVVTAHPPNASSSVPALDDGRSAPALATQPARDPPQSARFVCWVTGDMIGDANPATVVATACGR